MPAALRTARWMPLLAASVLASQLVVPPRVWAGDLAASAPSSSPTTAATEARARFDEAHRLFEAQEYAQAIADLKQAYVLDPRSEYLYALAQAERLAGDCNDAIVAYDHYLEASDADPTRVPIAREMIAECRKTLAAKAAASAPASSPTVPLAAQVAAELAKQEEARQEQERRAEQAQAELARRKEAAETVGHGWRVLGVTAIVVGSVGLVLSAGALVLASHVRNQIGEYNGHPGEQWTYGTVDSDMSLARTIWYAGTIGGGALLVGGIAAYSLGAHERTTAREEAAGSSVEVVAAPLPGGASLSLSGVF